MDTLSLPQSTQTKTDLHLHAKDLQQAFIALMPTIKTLSLDCFDTLLWRKTATPGDVFYALQNRPAFRALGFSARMRVQAETNARKIKIIQAGTNEVTLPEIYRAAFPTLSDAQISALAAEELAEEVDACYPFPPVVDLIRAAKINNIKIIIVSDTYFTGKQLRQLLTQHLPDDVMSAIDDIFCSSEHGISKPQGLLNLAMNKLRRSLQSTLHIGDNIIADFAASQALGAQAIHLLQFDEATTEVLRMQAIAGSFLDPGIRHTKPLYSPFRGLLSTVGPHFLENPATAIGYAATGPLLYAFGKFILENVAALRAAGKHPKVLFLMRDGYLPSLICHAINEQEAGACVNISRFVSLAASFRTKTDIDLYLSDAAGTLRFKEMCKQLLLPEHLAKAVVERTERAGNRSVIEFIQQIQQDNIINTIIEQSTAYRARLRRHLEKRAGVQPGDTLVFVDLGYTGTAQVKLEPIFREEMQMEIRGLYLLSLDVPGWAASRRGLLDPSWCDERTLLTLLNYIALLEQICTSNENSVIDFDAEGEPLFTDTAVNKKQHAKLDQIQEQCIRFATDAENFCRTAGITFSAGMLRETSLAQLGRLLFFPTNNEIQFLQSFEFELNMGTDDILRVLDQKAGLQGLRKRGLMFMEHNVQTMRTNYPAELRTAGLELSMLLLAQHRFGLNILMQDLSLLREKLEVIIISSNESIQRLFEAIPTHDGYYSLLIPAGTGNYQIGIQFGKAYHWVQIESTELIPTRALLTEMESLNTQNIAANLLVDKMTDHGNGLFFCESPASLLIYAPKDTQHRLNQVLRVVFRPVVRRETAEPVTN